MYRSLEGDVIGINVATHTNHNNPIDGIPTGATGLTSKYDTTLADYGSTFYSAIMASNYNENSFGSIFPLQISIINKVTRDTRLVFYPTPIFEADAIGNNEVAVYIDNIKVSIVPEED